MQGEVRVHSFILALSWIMAQPSERFPEHVCMIDMQALAIKQTAMSLSQTPQHNLYAKSSLESTENSTNAVKEIKLISNNKSLIRNAIYGLIICKSNVECNKFKLINQISQWSESSFAAWAVTTLGKKKVPYWFTTAANG